MEIVCWVAKSMQPFNIMKDRRLNCLIKMGWPEYKLPLLMTVGHDVHKVFTCVQERVTRWLQASIDEQ